MAAPEDVVGDEDQDEKPTFRIVAIGPLLPGVEHSLEPARSTGPVRIVRGGVDEALGALAPALAVDIQDPHDRRGKPLRVELRFAKMRDFKPEAIALRVPEIRGLKSEAAQPAPQAKAGEATTGSSLLDSLLDAGPAPEKAAAPKETKAFTSVLEDVMAQAQLRKLERAWRGLKLLVDRLPDGVIVDVFAGGPDEVDGILEALAETGGESLDLMIVDHEISASSHDLGLLSSWSQRAEAIGAPLIANTLPAVLGFDDLAGLAKTQRRVRSSEDVRAIALRAVAADDASRWVALAMNGPLGRARVTQEEGPFEEGSELPVGAGYGVGTLVAKSFGRTGWGCQLTGPRHGLLEDLAVGLARGGDVAISTEALMRDDAAGEAASAGVTLFTSVVNRDVALLPFAPMLFRGPVGPSGTSGPAQGSLADQVFVSRVSRAVIQLADAIPKGTAEPVARQVAQLMLTGLFEGATHPPTFAVRVVRGEPWRLEVTVKPHGFLGVGLEEVTLAARLG
jgi:type VI secretion system protein ImpC